MSHNAKLMHQISGMTCADFVAAIKLKNGIALRKTNPTLLI